MLLLSHTVGPLLSGVMAQVVGSMNNRKPRISKSQFFIDHVRRLINLHNMCKQIHMYGQK